MIIGPIWAIVVRFGRILRRGWVDREFRGVLYLVSIVIGAGTEFYRFIEDWTWTDAVFSTHSSRS